MIDTKLDDEIHELRRSISQTLQEAFRTFPPSQALQVADAVLNTVIECLGGTRVYIPKREDKPDWAAARQDYLAGASRDQVCRTYKISRNQFYRYVKQAPAQA